MARRGKPAGAVIDWSSIRRRVESAGRALDGEERPSPERARQILEERARALARPAVAPAADGALELLRFRLAGETYAVESRYVVEVFRLAEVCPLPGARAPVFGMTAWRGELLALHDLRAVLGLSVTALDDLGRVIVLGERRPAFGILADAVLDLFRMPVADVREPSDGIAARRELVRGVSPGAVVVLDAGKLLHPDES